MFQRGWSQSPAGIGWHWLVLAVVAVSGVVLGAWYMLNLVRRILFGPLREPGDYPPIVDVDPHGANGAGAHATAAQGSHHPERATHGHGAVGAHAAPRDLSFREILALAPLAVFVLWIGLLPGEFLRPIAPAVQELAGPIDKIIERDYAAPKPEVAANAPKTNEDPAAGVPQHSNSNRPQSPSRSAAGPVAASLAP